MEYATKICGESCNDQFIKYVGYNGYNSHICNSECGESCIQQQFFSKENINQISYKITELLMGVDKDNRPIIVPDKTICSIMSSVYDNFLPETGDIYSRYNIKNTRVSNYFQRMIDEVINIITTDVKVNLGIEECNKNLTIWNTVLGNFNKNGLQSHSKIKLREKRPMTMAFNMNY